MCRALDPVDKAGPELLCTEKGRVGGGGCTMRIRKEGLLSLFYKDHWP